MAQSKGRRVLVWVVGTVIAVLVLAGIGLQVAIYRNGPAVLNAVDRLTGGARGVDALEAASFGPEPAQKIYVYGAQQSQASSPPQSLPVLLFIHGGSWRNGNPDDFDFVARSFAPEGFVVVLAGYRLFPDAVFPAMLEDAASAIAWTKTNIAQYGGNPDHIILAGQSAGAYNVVMTALDPQWLAKEDLTQDDIAGVIGLSGPYDFYPFDSESTINSFGSAADPSSTQPINFVTSKAPPMLLIHGEGDTVVYPRNSIGLAKRLKQAGSTVQTKVYEGMDHAGSLTHLASPWRGTTDLHALAVEFARSPAASKVAPSKAQPAQSEPDKSAP